MKRMKRAAALALSAAMAFSLVGCGSASTSTQTTAAQTTAAAETTAAPTTAAVPETTAAVVEEVYDSAYEGDLYGTGAVGENGAASSASELASQIAVEIMQKGGNAVDAAVGMAYAVGMLEPAASGIGGAGQMVIYLAETDEYVVVEYMTQAPGAAIAETIDTSTSGNPPSVETIAIPGFVHGTMTALEKYGNLTAKEVLEPVIELARNGFPVTSRWNSNIEGRYENLSAYEYTMNLYTDEGFLYNEGDLITNEDIANTMELIANEGIEGFYNSDFTDQMVEYIQSLGGIVTREDFAQYTSKIREPISTTYNGYTVRTVNAPSNGGVPLLEMLNIIENFDISQYEHGSAESVQIINDAFALGYQDGLSYIADPDYYNLPVETMISKEYAAERAESITVGERLKAAKAGKLEVSLTETGEKVLADSTPDQGGTTHMTCMDGLGNVVSMTNTNGINFGSAVAVPGTGFVFSAHLGNLNNTTNARVNMLMPYIRVRTTICPSIVSDENGKPVMAVGSPGNWALVSATLNAIINYVDYDMNVAEAALAGRSWRDGISKTLSMDNLFEESEIKALEEMGYECEVSSSTYDSHVGCVSAVAVGEDGKFYAIGDYRRLYGSAAY